ncbi:MAG: hypothetical protein K2L93_07050 [Muribaculaceae bacterium]|nr:hypothetical protein [Muribaculaceae bacterium]MDE6322040.1 hypothetical protein [Muribaculaceae bacterium]
MVNKTGCISLLAALLLMAGCNTSGCLDNGSSIPLAGFYFSDGKPIQLDSLAIHGVGAPNDSLLITPGTTVSEVYLPLRSTANATSYVIHYTYKALDSDRYNDTISLDYTSIPYFVSEECGAMYYYHIDQMDYTTHLIESIEITDSLITNVDQQRLKIYMRQ